LSVDGENVERFSSILEKIIFVKSPTIEDYMETDQQTRLLANKLL
jgi:hypothetical protein